MENSSLNMNESEDCVNLTDDSNDAMMLDISTSNKLKENPILVPNIMFKPEEHLSKIEENSIWNFQSEKNKDLEDLIHRVLKNKTELEKQSNPNLNTQVCKNLSLITILQIFILTFLLYRVYYQG